MSGRQYLADTNAFVYLLQKKSFIIPLLDSEWCFSFITEIELLGKPRLESEELKTLKQLLKVAKKLMHVEEINEKAITLRQRYSIKTPDAIIAATAWQYKIPLITADSGFVKIKEIDLFLLDFT
jgi:predicted nucleic acid-binding protein